MCRRSRQLRVNTKQNDATDEFFIFREEECSPSSINREVESDFPTASLWLSGASSTHRIALTRQDPCIEEEEPACQPAGYKRKGATHLMVNQKSCSRYVPSLTRRILQPLRLSVPAASFIKPAEPLSVSSWCIYAIAYGGERCETPNTLCCCFQIDVALWGLRGKGCARVPSSQQKESSLTNWTNSTRS